MSGETSGTALDRLFEIGASLADPEMDIDERRGRLRAFLDSLRDLDRDVVFRASGSQRDELRRKWRTGLFELELDTARRAAAGGQAASSTLDIEGYDSVEPALIQIAPGNRGCIVHAGCGPYPDSLLSIHASASARRPLIGLDADPRAVLAARSLIANLPAARAIQILGVDAADYDYAKAEVVLLSNGLDHKAAALNRISATAPASVSVVLREPVGNGSLLYDPVPPSALRGWVARIRTRTTPFSRSVILGKA